MRHQGWCFCQDTFEFLESTDQDISRFFWKEFNSPFNFENKFSDINGRNQKNLKIESLHTIFKRWLGLTVAKSTNFYCKYPSIIIIKITPKRNRENFGNPDGGGSNIFKDN